MHTSKITLTALCMAVLGISSVFAEFGTSSDRGYGSNDSGSSRSTNSSGSPDDRDKSGKTANSSGSPDDRDENQLTRDKSSSDSSSSSSSKSKPEANTSTGELTKESRDTMNSVTSMGYAGDSMRDRPCTCTFKNIVGSFDCKKYDQSLILQKTCL